MSSVGLLVWLAACQWKWGAPVAAFHLGNVSGAVVEPGARALLADALATALVSRDRTTVSRSLDAEIQRVTHDIEHAASRKQVWRTEIVIVGQVHDAAGCWARVSADRRWVARPGDPADAARARDLALQGLITTTTEVLLDHLASTQACA